MLDNSVRGGQIFLHNLTMFKQVFSRSFTVALLVGIMITAWLSWPKIGKYDWMAATTYIKAYCVKGMHDNRINLHQDAKHTVAKVDVYNKRGLVAKQATAASVLNNRNYVAEYSKSMSFVRETLLILLGTTIGVLSLIFFLWSRFGKSAKATTLIRGGSVLTAQEVAKVLKRLKKASDFKIGDMPLVKDKETSHILLTGTTGSGKSNCMYSLLPQIRAKNQSAIVVDFTGDMVARYYDSNRGDIIINPFDARSHSWNFWKEVENNCNLTTIANSLFAGKGSNDEMWTNASKQFFEDAVKVHRRSINTRAVKEIEETKDSANHHSHYSRLTKDLYRTLATDKLDDVARLLDGTASASLLDPKNEKTAMSIRTNTIAFIDWLEELKITEKSISISEWFNSLYAQSHAQSQFQGQSQSQSNPTGQWLFLTASPQQRNKLRSFHSMLLDLSLNCLMEQGADDNRRLWFIIDELPSLKRLPSLPTGLAELRKYGGCIIAGIQSSNQLFELYGQNQAYGMLDQFNTKFIFRTEDNNFANYICKGFGEIEYKESAENYSYGAHEMRDGISFSKIERKKLLVNPSDLASLQDREAFVKLPETAVRIAKMRIPYQQSPKPNKDFVLATSAN